MSGFLGLGFIGLKGHWKWTNLQDEVQFGIVPAQVVVGERLCLGHLRIEALEKILHLGRLRMDAWERLLHLGEFFSIAGSWTLRERERAIAKVSFCEVVMSSSSSVQQQVRLPCARSNSFVDHKNSSSSSITTRWRRGKREVGHVCVHPQLHFTHQQLLQYYTTFVPRLYRIKATVVAFKDKGNCK